MHIYIKTARSGGRWHLGGIDFIQVVLLRWFGPQLGRKEFLNAEQVFLIVVREIPVLLMPGNIELIRAEWTDASELEDALSAIQHAQFVDTGQFFATMSSDE